MGTVPYGNSFLMVGGFVRKEDGKYYGFNSVYTFDPDGFRWKKLYENKLSKSRGASAVILVEEDWFPSC